MADNRPTSILFVDGTNLDHRLTEIGEQDVDFARFFQAVASGTNLLHTHYFTAPYVSSPNERKQRMRARQARTFNALAKLKDCVSIHKNGRYQPRPSTCRHCRRSVTEYTEKGTDVHVATQLVRSAALREADELILVSNDNDYVPAFQICNELQAKVVLAYVMSRSDSHRTINQLSRLAHRTIAINHKFMESLWIAWPPHGRAGV